MYCIADCGPYWILLYSLSASYLSLFPSLSLYSSLSLSLCVCSVRVRLLLFVCISVCVCLLVYFALFCLPGYRLLSILLPPSLSCPLPTLCRVALLLDYSLQASCIFSLCSNYNFQLFSNGFFIYTNSEWFPSISSHFLVPLPSLPHSFLLFLCPLLRQFVHSCMRSLSDSFYLTFSVRAWK